MSAELVNTIATIVGIVVAAWGVYLAFGQPSAFDV